MTTTSTTRPGALFLETGWAESFAVTGDGRVAVAWSTADGPRVHTVSGPASPPEPANTLPSIDQAGLSGGPRRIAFWAQLADEDNRFVLFTAVPGETPVRTAIEAPRQPCALAWAGPDHVVTTWQTADGPVLARVAVTPGARPETLWRLPASPRWLDPVPDVAPDGRIVLTVASETGQDIVVLDHGVVTPLLAGNRSAAPARARWSPDGRSVVVLVRRRRATEARLIDLVAGTMEVLDGPAPTEVPVWNGDGTKLAFAAHDWPVTRLYVHDLPSRTLTEVPAPAGTCAEAPQWHGDDCYFRVLGPDHPPAVRRWRPGGDARPVTPPATVSRPVSPSVVRLPSREGFDLPALAYEPWVPDRGTVVMLHGGPASCWRNGWNPVLLDLLGAGYRVVLLETRGTTFTGWPVPPVPVTEHGVREVEDVADSVAALIRLGLAQPGRIVLAGHSHGAFIAYRASLALPEVAGVITTSGYLHPAVLAGSGDPEVHRFAAAAFADRAWAGDPEAALPARCPVLSVHGERDKQVPAGDAEAMFARLDGAGHTWLLLADDDHSFRIRRNAARYAAAARDFLGRVLA